VSFASATARVCTVDGSTVTIAGAGDCTVTASQAATTATTPRRGRRRLRDRQGDQTITFGALGAKTFGDAAFP
jgi:hypothetical protein